MTNTPADIPQRLARLPELAADLWWAWHDAREVFRSLDYPLWRETAHNPVLMLARVRQDTLDRAADDPAYLARYDAALAAFDAARAPAVNGRTWWSREVASETTQVVAYFCAEFALHQSLPIYAGGLGVLAGDHCKEASDLGIPFVGVGFMYPQGYFRQRLTTDGWQEEVYEQLDRSLAPIERAKTVDGKPCVVLVPIGTRSVLVQVWEVRLGRVRLLLLDTDNEKNAPEDRALSARLYGGGRDVRLQQEIVLGLGGVLALRALGLSPAVWHLNEGHAAFVILQRLRDAISAGKSWDDAMTAVRDTTAFTTHTPVPAGHDAFPLDMVREQLAGSWESMNGHQSTFLDLGTYDNGHGPEFNMTALAMRSASSINAVSKLHGEVTREMFAPLWPDTPAGDRPVEAVTNGVHVPTWVAPALGDLFSRHLSPAWLEQYQDEAFWQRVLSIPDDDLWAARDFLRMALFQFIRERARQRWIGDPGAPSRVVAGGGMLDPNALTIGFARRFTGYKRPDLLFRDADRLARLVNADGRPVQFVFSGKAHPADEGGKHHLQTVMRHALDARFGGRIAFVEDYDLHVAHRLVQGCDVWMNTPRKPMEASGTSGMKAAMNGTLHLSILDGWWAEGYTGTHGWAIDPGTTSSDHAEIDAADAEALFATLENEVVPAFYERDAQGLPRRWIEMVKRSILEVVPRFSARRMLKDYVRLAYRRGFEPRSK